jgi:hypothetical protein
MRIVDLDTFLAMPSGTLFEKYMPQITSEMGIKWDNCGPSSRDFVVQPIQMPLISNLLDEMELDSSVSHQVNLDYAGRDGMFEESQLFLVWEARDVKALIARLNDALTLSEG